MILNIVSKDIKRALRDRKALIIIIVMPAVLITILGFSVGKFMNAEEGWIEPSTIGIVNLDKAKEGKEKLLNMAKAMQLQNSNEEIDIEELRKSIQDLDFQKILIEDILESESISTFLSYKVLEEEEAIKLLKEEKLSAVVIIPEDFTYYTMMNLASPLTYRQNIQVLKNKNYGFTGRIVEEIMNGFTRVLSAGIIAKSSILEVGAEVGVGDQLQSEISIIAEKIMEGSNKISMITKDIPASKPVNGMQYYSVAQAMMFVLYVASYGAKYAFNEMKNNTFNRLKIGNVTALQMLISRAITTSVVTIIQIFILVIYSSLVFKISWGNPVYVGLLAVVVALNIGGISALLTAMNFRLGNPKISNFFESIVIMVFAGIGGSFIPLYGMPLIQKIGSYTPTGTAINGYLKIMQGYELQAIGSTFGLLISITIVCLAISIVILKQEEVA